MDIVIYLICRSNKNEEMLLSVKKIKLLSEFLAEPDIEFRTLEFSIQKELPSSFEFTHEFIREALQPS